MLISLYYVTQVEVLLSSLHYMYVIQVHALVELMKIQMYERSIDYVAGKWMDDQTRTIAKYKVQYICPTMAGCKLFIQLKLFGNDLLHRVLIYVKGNIQ